MGEAIMTIRKITILPLIGFLLFIASCSSTTVNGVWKDPSYKSGRLNKVLVVSIAKKDLMRRLYEDKFVSKLRAAGLEAAPGYQFLKC